MTLAGIVTIVQMVYGRFDGGAKGNAVVRDVVKTFSRCGYLAGMNNLAILKNDSERRLVQSIPHPNTKTNQALA
ncbi:MAG: hypothetical protein CMJ21_05935 [Phycisphaerae bacterium]|nr:hypothetical protein [Phycisphaerae bacterium]